MSPVSKRYKLQEAPSTNPGKESSYVYPSSPNSKKKFFTHQDIEVWLLAAGERRAKLHLQAAGPLNSHERHEAFAHMSELLLEAFEEMRVISGMLREDSEALRSHADGLRARSQNLLDRHGRAAAPSERFIAPSPEEVKQAESRMLELFKNGHSQGDS